MQNLPIFPGGDTYARDINNLGQIVGYATAADGTNHSFLYSQGGPLVELDPSHPALLINDAGEVAAIAGSGTTFGTYISNGGTGAWINIGSLGGTQTYPEAINSRGDIVGYALDASGTDQSAFLFSNGTLTSLPSFGGTLNTGYGINDYGEIVGGSTYPGNTTGGGFVYFGSGPIEDLNNLVDPSLGWAIGNAWAVNDRGQITVTGTQPGARACTSVDTSS